MHIGIDAHALGAKQGGNETYIKQLILALAQLDHSNRYTLYISHPETARQWHNFFAPRHPNFEVRQIPEPTPLVRVPLYLSYELRQRPVDVLHVQYTAPPFCPVPVVVTIHDLAFEHLPQTFTRRGAWQLKMTVRRTARHAARIATVSEFSRKDIVTTYRLPKEKVVVTYNGVNANFNPSPNRSDEAVLIRQKYGIARAFILTVGSLQPRKNLVRLIRAYSQLRTQYPEFGEQLVIVGRKLWLHDEIFKEVKEQRWSKDVILTGYVPEEDLPALYRAARAFAYPSFFEGFGLPVLEAMACGTPVVTSNLSSMPEITGEGAMLVDPFEEQTIAAGLYCVVTDESLRYRLREDGLLQAQRFTWRNTAEKTFQLYHETYGETRKAQA
jgi:glycosyltransferase involved in cell wall biosynthesis